jgi:sec-independent protein translocase protein TatA
MPFRMGPTELLIILLIVFLIFGAGKLPQIGSSMGQAIKGFKDAVTGEEEERKKKASRTSRTGQKKA